MDLSDLPVRLPGFSGLVGRALAYLLSGGLVVMLWLIRPRCPLLLLMHSSLFGYRTKLFLLAAAAFVIGLLLHSLAPIILNSIFRLLRKWPWFKKKFADFSPMERDFLNLAHAAFEMETEIGLPKNDEMLGMIRRYYEKKYPELMEDYQGEEVLVTVTADFVLAVLVSAWVTAPNLRYWVLGLLPFAFLAALSQMSRSYRVLTRVVALGYVFERKEQTGAGPFVPPPELPK